MSPASVTDPDALDARSVERRLATAELVLEIATAAAGELELDEILRIVLSRLSSVVTFTGGSIALVERDDLVIRAAIGLFEEEAIGTRQARGQGRGWRIVESLVPERYDSLQEAGLPISGAMASQAVHSWLGVPIPRAGVGIGLLEVDSTARAAFTVADEELVATVARALAGPIDLAARYDAERQAREVRDAFSGMVSHELRTPITTIYGMMTVLKRSRDRMPVEQQVQLIEDVELEADRLRRLIEDLMVLGRAENGRLEVEVEPLAIGHLLRRALADEARRWPGHRFEKSIPSWLPIVAGEDVHVEQVLRNLLSNAAKYSPPGSTIRLSAREVEGGVEVSVADEGIGLPDGDPERLFDLYYRSPEARRQASGAGIGLFVCRQLLAAMGGTITARPGDPTGSKFVFTLPVALEA